LQIKSIPTTPILISTGPNGQLSDHVTYRKWGIIVLNKLKELLIGIVILDCISRVVLRYRSTFNSINLIKWVRPLIFKTLIL